MNFDPNMSPYRANADESTQRKSRSPKSPASSKSKKSPRYSPSPRQSPSSFNFRENTRIAHSNSYLYSVDQSHFSIDSIPRRHKQTRISDLISRLDREKDKTVKNATWKKPISSFKYHVQQVEDDAIEDA